MNVKEYALSLIILISIFISFLYVYHSYTQPLNDDPRYGQVSDVTITPAYSTGIEEDIFSELSKAVLLVDIPSNITYKTEENISLTINPYIINPNKLKEIIEKYDIEIVSISNRMEADFIRNDNFEIKNITPATQVVSEKTPTSWQWSVIPRKSGYTTLYISLNTIMEVDGVKTKRAVKIINHDIMVETNFWKYLTYFYLTYWKWIWSTIILPVFAIILKNLFLKYIYAEEP